MVKIISFDLQLFMVSSNSCFWILFLWGTIIDSKNLFNFIFINDNEGWYVESKDEKAMQDVAQLQISSLSMEASDRGPYAWYFTSPSDFSGKNRGSATCATKKK